MEQARKFYVIKVEASPFAKWVMRNILGVKIRSTELWANDSFDAMNRSKYFEKQGTFFSDVVQLNQNA